MSIRTLSIIATATFALSFAAPPAHAKRLAWKTHTSKKFGFSMNVPKGTVLLGKDWKNGWGGVYGNYWGVQVWGVAHLGKRHKPAAFKIFGIIVTGIPAKHWRKTDQGKNANGFRWYQAYRATGRRHVVVGIFGVGKRGSYLLVLKTTRKSFARDKAKYLRWYKGIKVF